MPEENTNQFTAPGIPPVDNAALPSTMSADNSSTSNNSAEIENNTVSNQQTSDIAAESNHSPEEIKASFATNAPITTEVANKIAESKNVLIALSGDPSVDEMAAAIGLSLFLDKLGKRATAIYSGTTPNALEFLKPEDTFEPTADTLQDFVVALNKDKADHLRYKLDGDYVKIYITPYKTRIAEEDLDFSYGDYNVDLVLALDVSNGIDLDSALREHGRIMHDAVIINITTGNPGKFGEIEWSDKNASSVSEMIAKMLYGTSSSDKIGKEEATAFLTGIVAATNRFSNASTTPETMQIASKLMDSGANQQLVSQNITPDIENEMFSLTNTESVKEEENNDPTDFDIEHGSDSSDSEKVDGTEEVKGSSETEDKKEEPESEDSNPEDKGLLDDLKEAEESLSHAGDKTTPETEQTSVKIDSENNTSNMDEISTAPSAPAEATSAPAEAPSAPAEEPAMSTEVPTTQPSSDNSSNEPFTPPSDPEKRAVEAPAQEKVLTPSEDFDSSPITLEDENKYGKMLEDALESVGAGDNVATSTNFANNPAAMSAPSVANNPDINGVPEMNYMPMPDEQILPPPPAPPIDMSSAMPNPNFGTALPGAAATPVMPVEPAAPAVEPTPESLGSQPAMQDQVYGAQAADPGAFKIPGM